jgi:hypothetical protein
MSASEMAAGATVARHAPASLAGTRMQRAADPRSRSALDEYTLPLLDLLELDAPKQDGALKPRRLELDGRAADLWRAFADDTERQLGRAGCWSRCAGSRTSSRSMPRGWRA